MSAIIGAVLVVTIGSALWGAGEAIIRLFLRRRHA